MTPKEMAARLDGRQYMNEISDKEIEFARENRLVVIFGRSDDMTVLLGAVNDAIGSFEGASIYFNHDGILINKCDNPECPYFVKELEDARVVTAVWSDFDDPCWSHKTDIDHASFMIYEEKEKYCQGIVFSLDDLKSGFKIPASVSAP